MLISITPQRVTEVFGLIGVTYFPCPADTHMQENTARFLANVGLPENSFFSARLDPEDESVDRLDTTPTLKAFLEAQGAECPPESEGWEILGTFNYSTVALDPRDGRVYAFPEAEETYTPMNADISSFVHSLIVLEEGRSEYKGLPEDDGDGERTQVVEGLRQKISTVDETPFAREDSAWFRLFEEIGFGMWG